MCQEKRCKKHLKSHVSNLTSKKAYVEKSGDRLTFAYLSYLPLS